MTSTATELLDVLVVGAGLSGIGIAHYLSTQHPEKSFTILEARGATGGTWDLFRYPGIRSDSDLHTFSYEFKPWLDEQVIADGDKILAYLREAAAEDGTDAHIRLHHKVLAAQWSSDEARWTVDVERTDTGERLQVQARWLFTAAGYYSYAAGHTPDFPGRERFRGTIVHPQDWPADLDYTGKQVVVIGSGATAVTLVPAMADRVQHITMLQRTPTYVMPLPGRDQVAKRLAPLVGPVRAHKAARQLQIEVQRRFYQFCQKHPKAARRLIRSANVRLLPEGYPVDKHFNPPYDPWDQRLCAVPDGDLYQAIRRGKASVVTDRIVTFTETGIQLASGTELEADIIVAATGLDLQPLGGIALSVDGRPIRLADTVTYRGLLLSGLPNFAHAVGYTNSSWTLKIGPISEYLCRLLSYLDEHDFDAVWPVAPADLPRRPMLDFGAGYVQRAADRIPTQGDVDPWRMAMDYRVDDRLLRKGQLVDRFLRFSGPGRRLAPAPPPTWTADRAADPEGSTPIAG